MCGFAEQLEWIEVMDEKEFELMGGKKSVTGIMLKAAMATCDFYIDNTPVDGIPYWDTGAPGLADMGDYLTHPSDPFNEFEPVDSSAAAIGSQGLLRLGRYLISKGDVESGNRYWQAGLTVLNTLLDEPYLSVEENHQGLLLHSVYHRPNGWDYLPSGSSIPRGESSMWGDYHFREVCLYLKRIIEGGKYYTYFSCVE